MMETRNILSSRGNRTLVVQGLAVDVLAWKWAFAVVYADGEKSFILYISMKYKILAHSVGGRRGVYMATIQMVTNVRTSYTNHTAVFVEHHFWDQKAYKPLRPKNVNFKKLKFFLCFNWAPRHEGVLEE
jgi:hypothetical protein